MNEVKAQGKLKNVRVMTTKSGAVSYTHLTLPTTSRV